MATKIVLKRYIESLKYPNIYTPIVEAIMNSIQSIEAMNNIRGKIIVKIIRDSSLKLTDDDDCITGFEISDNGEGFNKKNIESWEYVLSESKLDKGGKGLGRISYIQSFDDVRIESSFNENNKVKKVFFNMKSENLIDGIKEHEISSIKENVTTIYLSRGKRNYLKKLNNQSKTLDTFARKLLEKLLVCFVDESFTCPEIIIEDGSKKIILNELAKETKYILPELNKDFIIKSGKQEEKFRLKLFKVYYAEESHHLFLCANNIIVTEDGLKKHIIDLEDTKDFIKENDSNQHSYSLKGYILGDYLDKHVDYQRMGFDFYTSSEADLFKQEYIIDENLISQHAINIIKEHYKEQLDKLKDEKRRRIEDYIQNQAPYYDSYLEEINLDTFTKSMSNYDIESAFHKVEFVKRQEVLTMSKNIQTIDSNEKQIDELVKKYTELQKTELSRYISMRKIIIDLFNQYLKLNEKDRHEKEEVIHKLIYPMRSNSNETEYGQHNLRLIDERLSFYKYISSDQKFEKKQKSDRGDIIFFDNPIAVRGGNEKYNPITVFEIKRPQRKSYGKDDDPIKQIARYVEKIRKGVMNDFEDRPIYADENTPAYGFVLCDINNPKIQEFATDASLIKTSDGLGYIGYHPGYKIYFEIMSFDKIVKDAEQRNAILFHKLGLK